MQPVELIAQTIQAIRALAYALARAHDRHPTRLQGKLGLRSRVQAVVLAYECGLVLPRSECRAN